MYPHPASSVPVSIPQRFDKKSRKELKIVDEIMFQFLKGSIKSREIVFIIDAYACFNSSKVR